MIDKPTSYKNYPDFFRELCAHCGLKKQVQ